MSLFKTIVSIRGPDSFRGLCVFVLENTVNRQRLLTRISFFTVVNTTPIFTKKTAWYYTAEKVWTGNYDRVNITHFLFALVLNNIIFVPCHISISLLYDIYMTPNILRTLAITFSHKHSSSNIFRTFDQSYLVLKTLAQKH